MKGLVVYSAVGDDDLIKSGTDKKYFRLLANNFRRANHDAEINIETFDEGSNSEFFSDLKKPQYQNLDVFAYIGHGGAHYLYSANVGPKSTQKLAETLIASCNDDATILFYACSSGTLTDSILATLQRLTQAKRFKLYGHSTIGRAGNNPNKTVFPPAGGAMLIDVILGDLSGSPVFRRAWNDTFGNEADNLWATFWRMSDEEILFRACKPAFDRAIRANKRYMTSLGWAPYTDEIFEAGRFIPPNTAVLSEENHRRLALAIASWQMATLTNKRDVDGILGPNSWKVMQAELGLAGAAETAAMRPSIQQPALRRA